MNKTLYMAVTNDEYELPIFVCDTAQELADKLGVKMNTVYVMLGRESKHKKKLNRHGKHLYRKVVLD